MLNADRLACGVATNTLGLAKALSKCSNRKCEAPKQIDCQNSERNTLTSYQQLAPGKRAKGACPTSSLDLEREQKEHIQPAPLCRQESKRTASTGTFLWAIAIWFLRLLSLSPSRLLFGCSASSVAVFSSLPLSAVSYLVQLWATLQSSQMTAHFDRTHPAATVTPATFPPSNPPGWISGPALELFRPYKP